MATPVRRHIDEEESYFVSMTDLMVGLLFIFIIMLMFFALQYREAEREKVHDAEQLVATAQENREAERQKMQATEQAMKAEQRYLEAERQRIQATEQAMNAEQKYLEAERQKKLATDQLVNSEQVRDGILEDLQHRLRERGINVEIVKDQGILRLPEEILFDKSKADINERGEQAVAALADALAAVLPCYTVGPLSKADDSCGPHRATVESIYIEGHTDVDRLSPRPGMKDNLDLSAIRATNTFRLLLDKNPSLLDFRNKNRFPVVSVSGYGQYRPVQEDQSTEAQKTFNRRIDLRILMTTPRSEDAQSIEDKVQRMSRSAWASKTR
jgi:flagellar motor protein MotB